MKTNVKVGRLWMNNKVYRAGDELDLSEEQIVKLGTSVERVVNTVAEIDERDAKIEALTTQIDERDAKIAELESTINVAQTVDNTVKETVKTMNKRGRK